MEANYVAVGLAALSLVTAAISLGWNIYRDVVLKPRLKVGLAVCSLMTPGDEGPHPQYVSLRATNLGPGNMTITGINGRNAPFFRRLVRRGEWFIVTPDFKNSDSTRVPHRLEVGDSASLLLPYDPDCVLGKPFTHIGLTDSFGRTHWTPRGDIVRGRKQFKADFGDVEPN